AEIAAANLDTGHINNAGLRMGFAAGELIGRKDGDDFGDAGNGAEGLGLELLLIADDTDNCAVGAAAQMSLEAEGFDALNDVVYLVVAGAGFEDDDHGNCCFLQV